MHTVQKILHFEVKYALECAGVKAEVASDYDLIDVSLKIKDIDDKTTVTNLVLSLKKSRKIGRKDLNAKWNRNWTGVTDPQVKSRVYCN